MYASINAMEGREIEKYDDLESLGYILFLWIYGYLPWENYYSVNYLDLYEFVSISKK